ncbi:MAG: PEP-CTERM sorting domain-containing protein [Verrucomicrobiales bacterium]
MKSIVALLALSASAHSSVILVDFNNNASGAIPGGTWNTYGTTAEVNGSTLDDEGNSSTAVTLSYTGTMSKNTSNFNTLVYQPTNNGGNNPAWAYSTGNNGVAGDNFFTSTDAVANAFTLDFSNIAAGSTVSIDLLASRNSGNARGFFDYSLDGGSTWQGFTVVDYLGNAVTSGGWDSNTTATQVFNLQSHGYTNHYYLNATGTLSGSQLLIRTTDATSDSGVFSAMNGLRLTIVPEPSTAGLLALALGSLARRRRRVS